MKASITVISLLACGLLCQCKNEATEIKSVGKVAVVGKEVTSENAVAEEDSSNNNANNDAYFERAGKPEPEATATLEVMPEERPMEELQSPSPVAQPSQSATPSPSASASATPSPSMTPSAPAQPANPKVTLQSVCNNQLGFRLRFVEPFFASTVTAFRFTGCETMASMLNGQGFPKVTTVEALTGGQNFSARCLGNSLRLNIRQGFGTVLNVVTIESAATCLQIRNMINAAKI